MEHCFKWYLQCAFSGSCAQFMPCTVSNRSHNSAVAHWFLRQKLWFTTLRSLSLRVALPGYDSTSVQRTPGMNPTKKLQKLLPDTSQDIFFRSPVSRLRLSFFWSAQMTRNMADGRKMKRRLPFMELTHSSLRLNFFSIVSQSTSDRCRQTLSWGAGSKTVPLLMLISRCNAKMASEPRAIVKSWWNH